MVPVRVQCLPVSTFLQALDVKHIDYFSLTTGDFEVLQVLSTVPLGQVTVDVFSVSYMTPALDEKLLDDITNFFQEMGHYEIAGKPDGDVIFVKKGITSH